MGINTCWGGIETGSFGLCEAPRHTKAGITQVPCLCPWTKPFFSSLALVPSFVCSFTHSCILQICIQLSSFTKWHARPCVWSYQDGEDQPLLREPIVEEEMDLPASAHDRESWDDDGMRSVLTELGGWEVFTGNPGADSGAFQVEGVREQRPRGLPRHCLLELQTVRVGS